MLTNVWIDVRDVVSDLSLTVDVAIESTADRIKVNHQLSCNMRLLNGVPSIGSVWIPFESSVQRVLELPSCLAPSEVLLALNHWATSGAPMHMSVQDVKVALIGGPSMDAWRKYAAGVAEVMEWALTEGYIDDATEAAFRYPHPSDDAGY